MITFPGVAITWGLVVMVMVYSVGHISGAHFNPSVTIAFASVKRFPWKQVFSRFQFTWRNLTKHEYQKSKWKPVILLNMWSIHQIYVIYFDWSRRSLRNNLLRNRKKVYIYSVLISLYMPDYILIMLLVRWLKTKLKNDHFSKHSDSLGLLMYSFRSFYMMFKHDFFFLKKSGFFALSVRFNIM